MMTEGSQQHETMKAGDALTAFMGQLLANHSIEDAVIVPDNCKAQAASVSHSHRRTGSNKEKIEEEVCPMELCRWDVPGGCHHKTNHVLPTPPPRRRLSLQDTVSTSLLLEEEEEEDRENPKPQRHSDSSCCRLSSLVDLNLNANNSTHSATSIDSDAPPACPRRKASLTGDLLLPRIDLQLLALGDSCSSLLEDSSNSSFDDITETFSELTVDEDKDKHMNNEEEATTSSSPYTWSTTAAPDMRVSKTA